MMYLKGLCKGLTAILRQAGAALDNNMFEHALQRSAVQRKTALFYQTMHGAEVGDLLMSLIHSCQLAGANSFEYLTELQRHVPELIARPAEWMPWNFREKLAHSPLRRNTMSHCMA